MRIALAVHRVGADLATNIEILQVMAAEAAGRGADLILFSEAALSGFVGSDAADQDQELSEPIPGRATELVGDTARRLGVSIGFGMYEQDRDGRLYDAGVLIGPDGAIHLHYRRISPQWHGPDADPLVYRQGNEIPLVRTSAGRTCMLLCGDLFDDAIMERVSALHPDLLLVPFAREFDSDVADERAWVTTEVGIYAGRAALSGAATALVNQIGPGRVRRAHFGGAIAVDRDGTVLATLDLHTEGLPYQDLPTSSGRWNPFPA